MVLMTDAFSFDAAPGAAIEDVEYTFTHSPGHLIRANSVLSNVDLSMAAVFSTWAVRHCPGPRIVLCSSFPRFVMRSSGRRLPDVEYSRSLPHPNEKTSQATSSPSDPSPHEQHSWAGSSASHNDLFQKAQSHPEALS